MVGEKHSVKDRLKTAALSGASITIGLGWMLSSGPCHAGTPQASNAT